MQRRLRASLLLDHALDCMRSARIVGSRPLWEDTLREAVGKMVKPTRILRIGLARCDAGRHETDGKEGGRQGAGEFGCALGEAGDENEKDSGGERKGGSGEREGQDQKHQIKKAEQRTYHDGPVETLREGHGQIQPKEGKEMRNGPVLQATTLARSNVEKRREKEVVSGDDGGGRQDAANGPDRLNGVMAAGSWVWRAGRRSTTSLWVGIRKMAVDSKNIKFSVGSERPGHVAMT
ncbi:hypothetical protein B0H11DRAFT_1904811 [Mycena galericulata]|nr:hypothetical protein B0H11DRAFT_1904811 [Mycena galericulata]